MQLLSSYKPLEASRDPKNNKNKTYLCYKGPFLVVAVSCLSFTPGQSAFRISVTRLPNTYLTRPVSCSKTGLSIHTAPFAINMRRGWQITVPSLHSLATRISSTSIWLCIRFITWLLSCDFRLYAMKTQMMTSKTNAPMPHRATITVKLNLNGAAEASYISSPITNDMFWLVSSCWH